MSRAEALALDVAVIVVASIISFFAVLLTLAALGLL